MNIYILVIEISYLYLKIVKEKIKKFKFNKLLNKKLNIK